MNRNRIYFALLMLVLVIVITSSAYQMLNAGKKEDTYHISVIVDDGNSDRWIAMREGLEHAARDNGIDLNFVFYGKFGSMEEELELIRRELENGADGVIVQPISGTGVFEGMGEISAKAAVVLLESDVEPQGLYGVVGPNNREIGQALGNTIAEKLGDALKGKKIGILCGNPEQIAMQERLMGVQEALEETGAEILWTLENHMGQGKESLEEYDRKMPVEILIALGNEETEQAVDYVLTKNCLLYGVGCSEKAVYYLDKGLIQFMVVPNEFNMGYLSVEQIAGQLNYRLSQTEGREVGYLIIDRENLYREDTQKILFPIVQ